MNEENIFTPSSKDNVHIIHEGTPGRSRSPFTSPICHPKWPENLHTLGTQIYSISDHSLCLPPRKKRTDKLLRFNSHFESGNLESAFHIERDIYRLNLEYDKNRSGSCQWFYFEIKNTHKDAIYQFYITGFHKNKDVLNSGSKVFMYSQKAYQSTGAGWTRSGYNYAYAVTCNRSTLQFQIRFSYDADTVYLSYSLPYTYSHLLKNIFNWSKKSSGIFSSETLCQTVGGRDCPLITITSPLVSNDKKKIIFITGRVHPGESNSSYVVHGFIDFLLMPSAQARYLLERYIFKIIPMINIDGVIEGFYRCSLSGYDLNRVWSAPDSVLHPVIFHAKNFMEFHQNSIELYIDFHGHSRLHGTFAYGCPNDDDSNLKNKEKILPRIITMLSDAFTWQRCEFSYPNSRKSSGRIVARKEFGIVQSFTIETSFGGITQGPLSGLLNDEKIWKGIGSKVVEAIYHFFNQSTGMRKFAEKELQNGLDPQKNEFSTLQWQREMKKEFELRIISQNRNKTNQLALPFTKGSANSKSNRPKNQPHFRFL
ncbi:Clan MC, family M14, Zinc carboxypeptidase-like metallopeptidase [Tritrichomonas foetus]|uniref:Clan MC, family M14, Zinc carboxypeptidase-like metallopeptidase n=1 Tax=Tritrichomonas foetus TaxID=1144522 RepID=A0A1J4JGW7_9EUKA|nr:Clan MC, family M14, Zinc carboxypeptidase-like metallopeptidase [Tritrichomonas foetus]|eukprot:OHS96851.1 Clan MC, family M14, Zinc carboxypeptidase-like metallopeptidase [Tritrichomonas foetus]